LSKTHEGSIESSRETDELVEKILEVQKERLLTQDKEYFKSFIDQELKKSPAVNIDELGIYSDYAQEIDEIGTQRRLENYLERVTSKIYQVRGNKTSSLSEAQDQAKKNISKTFQRIKIKVQELHQQHQNWQAKIEKLEDISEILEFEKNFVLLLEKINCFCQQQ